jgi:hypothetical protein
MHLLEAFEPLVGSSFRKISGPNDVNFVLTSAEALPEKYAVPTREDPPFRLVFRCPENTPPVQKTFNLVHDTLGTVDLFLVPIGFEDGSVIMEGYFS